MFGLGERSWPLVATCSRGLEEVLADELRAVDASAVAPGRGMVSFTGGMDTVLATNLYLRSAIRVLVSLARGRAGNRDQLYDLAASVPWEEALAQRQTFAVEVAGRARAFRDPTFAARVVKDAVVDRLRSKRGQRPDVDRESPDVRLHLHISDGVSSLSVDSSGEPLSRRGYRPRGGPAPLNESLAAGILLLAGYDGSQPLIDPMCGTGTFAVEAALIATQTAPGLLREFAFERWAGHDRLRFQELIRRLSHQHRPAPAPIVGRDRDQRAVRATRQNLRAARMDRWAKVEPGDLKSFTLPWDSGGMVVVNPPYGKRVGDVKRLGGLYRRLGDVFKKKAPGATAWVLAGDRQLANQIGLKPSRRIPLFNGPIECRLLKYEMYEGSRRKRPGGSGSPDSTPDDRSGLQSRHEG
jgi:putative N6-adenine-specific DNA methylase